jgi:hypothetical protein
MPMLMNLVSPVVAEPEQEEMPTPKPMRRRYLNRNGTWLRAQKITHRRVGEPVYVRNGPANFEKIGVVGAGGVLPVSYVTTKGAN